MFCACLSVERTSLCKGEEGDSAEQRDQQDTGLVVGRNSAENPWEISWGLILEPLLA